MDDKITANNSNKESKRPLKKKLKKKPAAVYTPFTHSNPEINAMFAKIYAMKDDLDKKFSKVSELTGMSIKEIAAFLNNPNNFSPYQWQKMEMDKKNVEERLYLGLGKDAKEKTKKKLIEKQAKERRGKMIGARKKWLQM